MVTLALGCSLGACLAMAEAVAKVTFLIIVSFVSLLVVLEAERLFSLILLTSFFQTSKFDSSLL